ncbi:MAG: 2OG-Fe(II) oxygenase [Stellaceae bacterium]
MTAIATKERLRFIDLDAFKRTKIEADPFPYLIVPGFVPAAVRQALSGDYPKLDRPGSFPVADVTYGSAFRDFLAEIEGPEMRDAFARKFEIDLAGRPTMVTVRGQAQAKDGRIHTDSATKIITVLVYMNEAWEASGGRLRLLRSDASLDDMVAEVPPAAGTLLAFLVTPHSWHGHHPTNGPRRVVQLNWVESDSVVRRERFRHGLSARIKQLLPARR